MHIRIHNTKLALEIATDLLKIDAIQLRPTQPFIWSSGWKSPIYCDNRLSLSFPKMRSKLKDALSKAIQKEFEGVEAIVGIATAGIPHGALVADQLNLPFLYVRSASKKHGMQNKIEGKIHKKQRIVLIEDLVSTGGSAISAAEALKAEGANVMGIIAIFTYGFATSEKVFETHDIPLITLSDYPHLLKHAKKEGLFDKDVLDTLNEWRENPAIWEPSH